MGARAQTCKLILYNPTHAVLFFTWSGSKISLQHNATLLSCFALRSLFLPRSTLFSHMSVHGSECTEGTFRHMDLPFVYHLLDQGVLKVGAGHWLAVIHSAQYDWLWLTEEWWWGGGHGLKLGGDSWLLQDTEIVRHSNCSKGIPIYFCSLLTLVSNFSSLYCVPIRTEHTDPCA